MTDHMIFTSTRSGTHGLQFSCVIRLILNDHYYNLFLRQNSTEFCVDVESLRANKSFQVDVILVCDYIHYYNNA